VVPIFSGGNLGPTRLSIAAQGTGLHHDSVLFCEELTTIDEDFFEADGPRGRVPDGLLAEIVIAVRRALGDLTA
jgi:mRNA-degrading endonuclease toxin of MazEF toxin-antitoxin module